MVVDAAGVAARALTDDHSDGALTAEGAGGGTAVKTTERPIGRLTSLCESGRPAWSLTSGAYALKIELELVLASPSRGVVGMTPLRLKA